MILKMSYAWGMDVLEKEEGNMKKGPWTFGEDMKLIAYVTVNGAGRWNSVAKAAGLKRSGKSCRFRWLNYLHPGLKRGRITPKEQRLIFDLQRQWGNRWSRIARSLPGRTDNEIKNYWRTHVKKMSRESIRACSCPPASRSPIEIKAVIENPVDSSRKSFKGHQTDVMKEGYAEFNLPTILNQVRCDSCELRGGNESSLTSQDKHQEFIKESSDMDTLSCTVAEAYATSTIHDSPSLTDSPINVFSDSEEFFWDYNSIDLWNLHGVPADNVNQIRNL